MPLWVIHWINEERPKVMCVFAVPLLVSIYSQALTHCKYTQESSPTSRAQRPDGRDALWSSAFSMYNPLKRIFVENKNTVQCKMYMYANTSESCLVYDWPPPATRKKWRNGISRLLQVCTLTIYFMFQTMTSRDTVFKTPKVINSEGRKTVGEKSIPFGVCHSTENNFERACIRGFSSGLL